MPCFGGLAPVLSALKSAFSAPRTWIVLAGSLASLSSPPAFAMSLRAYGRAGDARSCSGLSSSSSTRRTRRASPSPPPPLSRCWRARQSCPMSRSVIGPALRPLGRRDYRLYLLLAEPLPLELLSVNWLLEPFSTTILLRRMLSPSIACSSGKWRLYHSATRSAVMFRMLVELVQTLDARGRAEGPPSRTRC